MRVCVRSGFFLAHRHPEAFFSRRLFSMCGGGTGMVDLSYIPDDGGRRAGRDRGRRVCEWVVVGVFWSFFPLSCEGIDFVA